jgi:serine phosphatase RsbU (regulator of sigma subunit)/putative methionine-R-sulfoxide reductase with GAF domain
MIGAGRLTRPDWKQYQVLGEELLNQPDSASQSRWVAETISRRIDGRASVWLAARYYPLPGEPKIETIPNPAAPHLVQTTLETMTITRHSHARGDDGACDSSNGAAEIAFPLLAQDNLLGVVHVKRADGPPFSPDEVEYLEGLILYAALTMQFSRQEKIKNWRQEQLALVRSVSAQIASVLDLDELCRQVTQLIQETFRFYYVGIFTKHDELLELRADASHDKSATLQPGFKIQMGEGLVGTAALTEKEILAPDVRNEPLYRYIDALPKTQSEVVIPLIFENRVVGVLDVQSDQLDAFHDIDMMVLHALSHNIVLAIKWAQLYHNLQRQNEQLAAVFEVAHAISSILDLDTLLEEVVQLIQKRFGYPFIHIFTVHPARNKIIFRRGSGARSQEMHAREISYNIDDPTGIIPWAVRNGQPRLCNDVEADPLYRPSELPPSITRSEMVVPLIFGRDVLGIMDVQSDQINAFTEDDLSLFESLANSVAIAIRNATLYRSERWRRQVADSLRDVASLITSNVALDTLLDRILSELERNLPCEASAIWLFDPDLESSQLEGRDLILAAVRGVENETVKAALDNVPAAREWLLQTAENKRPTIRRPKDPIGPLGNALNAPNSYSSIIASMRAGDQILGVLTLAHSSAGRYGPEAQAMTSTFASYAAVAVQNSRLFSEAQSQAWTSTVLLQVANASQSSNNIEDLLDTMVRLTPLMIGVTKCAFFLWDEATKAFMLKTWYGIPITERRSLTFDESSAPAFSRLRISQNVISIEDANRELNLPEAAIPPGSGSLVMLPLLAHGSLLGAFLVAHQPDSIFVTEKAVDEQTLAILRGIAYQTAVALENLSLIEARQEEGYVTAVLLQVAQAVASQNSLDDILDTIVHLMPILVGIDTCVIYLWDQELSEFYPAQAYSGSHDEEENLLCRIYQQGEFELLDKAFASPNHPLFAPLSDPSFPTDEWPDLVAISAEDYSTLSSYMHSSWLIGFPLAVKGETLGVLIAKDRSSSSAFRERRLEIISGVSQQIAMAIQNERLKEEMVERERIEREFQLAREIQQTFLPSHLPRIPGWDLGARWQTARTVGGDFYDIFRIGDQKVGLVIADVSDKGMPAALYMTVTRTLIRADARNTLSPAALLERVNNLLVVDAQNGMYVTAVYAVLDLETGMLTYANAGHNQLLLINGDRGKVERLQKGGMALAVLADNQYQEHRLVINPGDALIFYTDGITEQFSPDGEIFGEERLLEVLTSLKGQSVQQLFDRLHATLAEFRGGDPPSDDVTLLALRRLHAAEETYEGQKDEDEED